MRWLAGEAQCVGHVGLLVAEFYVIYYGLLLLWRKKHRNVVLEFDLLEANSLVLGKKKAMLNFGISFRVVRIFWRENGWSKSITCSGRRTGRQIGWPSGL